MKLRRSRLVLAGASLFSFALMLAGCTSGGSGSTGVASASSAGPITLGVLIAPSSFAAQEGNWANQSPLFQASYDTLLHATATNNTLEPWLATSWSYNADKTVLTMKLRSDVKFSDGTSFNASAAAQNLLRFRDGTSPDKGDLADMKNAVAVNPTTLQITLNQPDPAFLVFLSQDAGLMESPKAFSSKTINTVPVGSGPYVMDTKDTVPGSTYVFTPNPDYWAKSQTPQFSKLTFTVISDTNAALNAIKGGQVDGMVIADQTQIPTIQGVGYTVKQQNLDWEGLMLLDRGGKITPALGNVKVRQAINYAINGPAMLKAVAAGYGDLTNSLFPSYSPGYDKALDSYYKYSPAKAKQLLAEAGFAHFTLTLPRTAGFGDTANDLIKQYLGAVGINVVFQNVPSSDIINDLLAPKFSAAYFTLQEDPTAYQEATFQLTTDATWNPFHYNDPKVTALVKTIQTGTPAQSVAATKQLNIYTVQQAYDAVWFRDRNVYAFDSKITATEQAGNAYPYLYDIKPKG